MADITEREGFLLLVTVGQEYRADRAELAKQIEAVNQGYMSMYASAGRSLFHAALIGPYDFAIIFTGTHESTLYLITEIYEKLEGRAETLLMPWVHLDLFTKKSGRKPESGKATKKTSRG